MPKTLPQALLAAFCAILAILCAAAHCACPFGGHPLEGGGMIAYSQIFRNQEDASWTNPYVTDGLIAMWDGEWNAGVGVHDYTATTWKDLIGSIGDMHTYNGEVPEWGANCWTKTSETSLPNSGFKGFYADSLLPSPLTGTISVNICLYVSTVNFSNVVFSNRSAWTTGAVQYGLNSSGTKLTSLVNGATVINNGEVSLPFTGTSYCEFSGINFLNERFYINNIQNGMYPLSNISIYCLRVYNSTLTEEEKAVNEEIDKQRFNLP